MQWLSRSDVVVLLIASYVAVMSLVRLMRRRRDDLVADVQRQIEARRGRNSHSSHDSTKKDAA